MGGKNAVDYDVFSQSREGTVWSVLAAADGKCFKRIWILWVFLGHYSTARSFFAPKVSDSLEVYVREGSPVPSQCVCGG